jgi:multisubunit Na+/H+ antiporter MnhG subunit
MPTSKPKTDPGRDGSAPDDRQTAVDRTAEHTTLLTDFLAGSGALGIIIGIAFALGSAQAVIITGETAKAINGGIVAMVLVTVGFVALAIGRARHRQELENDRERGRERERQPRERL